MRERAIKIINRAINAIKKINRWSVLVNTLEDSSAMYCHCNINQKKIMLSYVMNDLATFVSS